MTGERHTGHNRHDASMDGEGTNAYAGDGVIACGTIACGTCWLYSDLDAVLARLRASYVTAPTTDDWTKP